MITCFEDRLGEVEEGEGENQSASFDVQSLAAMVLQKWWRAMGTKMKVRRIVALKLRASVLLGTMLRSLFNLNVKLCQIQTISALTANAGAHCAASTLQSWFRRYLKRQSLKKNTSTPRTGKMFLPPIKLPSPFKRSESLSLETLHSEQSYLAARIAKRFETMDSLLGARAPKEAWPECSDSVNPLSPVVKPRSSSGGRPVLISRGEVKSSTGSKRCEARQPRSSQGPNVGDHIAELKSFFKHKGYNSVVEAFNAIGLRIKSWSRLNI
jgi:hypothetical protein